MNIPDIINSGFEGFGAIAAGLNIKKILKDKVVKGIHWGTTAFFSFWGFWNIYYYFHLHQYFSLTCGAVLAMMNTIWVILALKGTKYETV